MIPSKSNQWNCRPARISRGWAMLESAVALGLLATILSIITVLMQKAGRDIDDSTSISSVNKGDVSLIAYFLVNKKLPHPLGMKDSPGRPGYKEGWLPLSDLEISQKGGQVRYLVHESLIENPPIYSVDPDKVTSGNLDIRTAISFADTCANLFKLELSDVGLPVLLPEKRSIRAGYVIQQIKDTSGQVNAVENIWPGDSAEPPIPPASLNFTTSALGFNELAGEVGCFNYMPKLTASVKAVGVAIDLAELSRLDVDLQALEVEMLKQRILHFQWEFANWTTLEASFVARTAVLVAGTSFTPGSLLFMADNAIPFAAMVTGAGYIMKQSKSDLDGAKKDLVEKSKMLDEAKQRFGLKSAAVVESLRNANTLQSVKDPL